MGGGYSIEGTGTPGSVTAVLGALDDAAAVDDPTTSDTVMQYIKQLINILEGAAGIASWSAAAAPGNNVSVHEVVRQIYDDVTLSLTGLAQKGGRITRSSNLQATVIINASAANKSLPGVVVEAGALPPNATITRVFAGISWRKQTDSSAAPNATVSAQVIEVDITGGFGTTAIDIPDDSFATAASASEGGMFLVGDNDIKAEVAVGSTTLFQWTAADVDGASLTLQDVQTHLLIEYE